MNTNGIADRESIVYLVHLDLSDNKSETLTATEREARAMITNQFEISEENQVRLNEFFQSVGLMVGCEGDGIKQSVTIDTLGYENWITVTYDPTVADTFAQVASQPESLAAHILEINRPDGREAFWEFVEAYYPDYYNDPLIAEEWRLRQDYEESQYDRDIGADLANVQNKIYTAAMSAYTKNRHSEKERQSEIIYFQSLFSLAARSMNIVEFAKRMGFGDADAPYVQMRYEEFQKLARRLQSFNATALLRLLKPGKAKKDADGYTVDFEFPPPTV